MRRKLPARALALALAIASTIACGSGGDTRATLAPLGPTPPAGTPAPGPPAAPPAGPPVRITVTDGWTNAPVPGAVLTFGSNTRVADAAGRFEELTPVPCVPATFVATGYLERRVFSLCSSTPDLSLWPVTNDAERAALQAFAFRFGGRLVRPRQLDVDVSLDVVNRDAVMTSWRHAGEALAAMTGGKVTLRLANLQDEGAIVAPWSDAADCNHSWFDWRFSAAGFCWGKTVEYFVYFLRVAPPLIASDDVALRALLYELGLRPHRLPGLMNETQPDTALSEFEIRTLRMIGRRAQPFTGGVFWPDTEF